MGSCPEGMTPAAGGGCVNMNPNHHNQMKRGGNIRKFTTGGSSPQMNQHVHQAHMTGNLNVNDVVHTSSHILCQNFDCSPFTTAGTCNSQQCCSFTQGSYGSSPYGPMSGTWTPGTCENTVALRKGGRLNKRTRRRKKAMGGSMGSCPPGQHMMPDGTCMMGNTHPTGGYRKGGRTKPRPARRGKRGRKFHAGGNTFMRVATHQEFVNPQTAMPNVQDIVHMQNHIMNGPYGGAPTGGRPGGGRRGTTRRARNNRRPSSPNMNMRTARAMKRGGRTKPIKKYPHGGQHCGPGMTMGAHGGCIPHSNGYKKGGRTRRPMKRRGRRR